MAEPTLSPEMTLGQWTDLHPEMAVTRAELRDIIMLSFAAYETVQARQKQPDPVDNTHVGGPELVK